jgi:hypothetical protein
MRTAFVFVFSLAAFGALGCRAELRPEEISTVSTIHSASKTEVTGRPEIENDRPKTVETATLALG